MQVPKLQTLFLSLGSNLGNREENLNQAIQLIRQNISTNLSISNIYETEPWGNLNQAGFLNLILKIENSSFVPHEILEKIQKIENELGRVRVEKWGERCIDIDIIYYDDLITGNVLRKVVVTKVSKNGFQDYMKSQGKLGGQNKIPRLSNDRNIADNLK